MIHRLASPTYSDLMDRVRESQSDECVVWDGTHLSGGYGSVHNPHTGTSELVHRVSGKSEMIRVVTVSSETNVIHLHPIRNWAF